MSADHDITVIGGGLAGASLACALADTGLSIALVEAVRFDTPADEPTDEPKVDNMRARTTAIAWGTRALFEQLGLWSAMSADAAPQQIELASAKVDQHKPGTGLAQRACSHAPVSLVM